MDNPPSKSKQNVTGAASSGTSNASSSSTSPYLRRNGLSPRQRRLLRASARAKASTAAWNAAANAARASPSPSPLADAPPSSPPATAPLARSSASSPESPLITPAGLKVPLSPIPAGSSPPSKRSPCSATIASTGSGSGSGASTAVLTDSTTASIENGFRRRLQLNDRTTAQPSRSTSPAMAMENDDVKNDGRDAVLREGEAVTKAMCGKVSDRIRAFNNKGGLMAQKGILSQHSAQSSRYSMVDRQPSGMVQNNNDGYNQKYIGGAQRDDLHPAYSRRLRAYSGNQSIGESIEEEVKNSSNHGPLHETIHPKKSHFPIQEKTRKNYQQKVISQSNRGKHWQPKLQSSQQQKFLSDEIDGDDKLRYYRVTFKGVVSLSPTLDVEMSEQNHEPAITTINEGGDSETYYVGYGEIIGTYSPEIIIPINSPENNRKRSGHVSETQFVRAIRVDSILTGGYAAAGTSSPCVTHCDIAQSYEMMTNQLYADSSTIHRENRYGYLFLSDRDQSVAEPLLAAISESLRSSTETGRFLYRVTASSPVSVLSGPSTEIGVGMALLPGTMHEVSLRISIPIPQQNNDLDDANDTLVDDADAGEIKFLRLGQRRGWVADRRIDSIDQKLRVSYLMQDVTNGENGSLACGPSSPSVGSLFDDFSFEGDTSSLNSSALNSTANSSFYYSSLVTASVQSPTRLCRRRRRRRRRPRVAVDGLEWSQQPAMAFSSLVRENEQKVEGSFEEGSSLTGGGADVVCDIDGDYSSNMASQIQPNKSFYLMRVLAPLGLKILDSPNFQVTSLIHSPSPTKQNPRNSPTATTSPFARTNAMIGSISAGSSPTLGTRKRSPRVRLLARGQIFEASQRMEIDSSLYTNGQGLIKLADGSGWAIVPHESDLIAQFKNFHGDEGRGAYRMDDIKAVEEIGNASGMTTTLHKNSSEQSPVWLQIAAPITGIKVLLSPHNTPSKHVDNQAEMGISTSSMVSSSFFGDVIPGRHNIAAANSLKQQKLPMLPVIPCGAVVSVGMWEPSTASKSFVRLFNGHGWIPRCLEGVVYANIVAPPDIRFGRFWFRVISRSGLDVRHGPSQNAQVIKSDKDTSFRFECGEFLKASEIITISDKTATDGDCDGPTECFARLYRRHNHVNNENGSSQNISDRFSSLHTLISPGEWVQVHRNGDLFLEQCSAAPRIERTRDGVLYRVVVKCIKIHCGPSSEANVIGELVCEGENILVTEVVTADGEESAWLRLKSGGWVSCIENGNKTVIRQTRPRGG